LQAIDADDPDRAVKVSMAKAKADKTAKLSVNEAVQMHGGIGMTDEFDIGFYMKRIRVAQEMFGDPAFHADRLAQMRGY
jgi:alkylation response protein AidB-like acyl-CoA dehydrogenase